MVVWRISFGEGRKKKDEEDEEEGGGGKDEAGSVILAPEND
jgi:hypothetical protein